MKTLKPGDIIVSTFGYDARLATFSKVIKRTAKTVVIAKILECQTTGSWESGTTIPRPNSRLGPETRKKVTAWYDGSCECVNDGYGIASLWDGCAVTTYNHH